MEKMNKKKVIMLGPARSVHGGISAVVNSFYEAGIEQRIELHYIGTMVDGSRFRKLLQVFYAYICFLFVLPRYDIVHVNMASDASYYRKKIFIDTAFLFRKKIVIHEHGGNFRAFYGHLTSKQQQNVKTTLNKADIFIVLSMEWKNFFSAIVTKTDIKILHNAVKVPVRGREDYSDHNLIFLGRICRDKGIAELLSAMDRIHIEVPDAHLYLAGNYEEACWEDEVNKRSDYVIWTGWIMGEEKEKLLRDTCSVFVLPSYYEGQPVSLMEAMSYGLAPIASAIGGITEIMSDKEGVAIPVKNVAILKDEIEQLVTDTDRKEELGIASRKRIIADYDIAAMVDSLCSIYDEI